MCELELYMYTLDNGTILPNKDIKAILCSDVILVMNLWYSGLNFRTTTYYYYIGCFCGENMVIQ